jgi:glycosyltransferase involved in cell wall biosynthesis
MHTPSAAPYVLVVRWPLGGIRTHLKYAKELAGDKATPLQPILVAMDDPDTRLLIKNLQIPSQFDHTAGIQSLAQMSWQVFKSCLLPGVKLVHSQGFISALLAYPAVLVTRKRHIVTVHDVVTDQVLASKSPWALKALGFVLKHAYAVHAVGRDCASSLRRIPGLERARNIVTIANGINSAQFTDPTPTDWRAQLNLKLDTKLIGFFGRFMEQKGFLDLVSAIARLKVTDPALDVRVLAVGEGDWLREYRVAVAEQGLEDTILFLPRAENPAALMAGCDVVVMPSHWEAYPLQAPEVLCLGIPLLASDCVGLREVTEGTPTRTFATGDCEGLRAALVAEFKNPSWAAARAYTQIARERFAFAPNALKINRLLTIANAGQPLPRQ